MARNALMDRTPNMNALMAPPAAGGRVPSPDEEAQPQDETEFWGLAAKAGYQGNDMQEAMRAVWKMMPTDGVGEMIEGMAQRYGVTPPWGQAAPQGQPGEVYPSQQPQAPAPTNAIMPRGRQ